MSPARQTELAATGREQLELHERASAATTARFGRRVFVRTVVEVSNYCRESCDYCGMRRENRGLNRYRASVDALAELLLQHRPDVVTDVMLQSGEDPRSIRDVVLPLLALLKREAPRLGLSICLGTLDAPTYAELREAGAEVYLMKFEIPTSERFEQLHAPGTLDERLSHIRALAANGWHVTSGFIAGLPGSAANEAWDAIQLARTLPLAGCSVSPFIPGESTPLHLDPPASLDLTLNCMAALRLARPEWIIPAVSALGLRDQPEGYRRGLRCGANLVTINLTPPQWRDHYLLYRKDRIIMDEQRILRAIEDEGLEPSTTGLVQHLRDTSKPALAAGCLPA
ncbi:MAG: radical SAM protein [Verrucomicrobiales bacterium]|nr:radical SAM protein [Verrucomicrobiales bacterium]